MYGKEVCKLKNTHKDARENGHELKTEIYVTKQKANNSQKTMSVKNLLGHIIAFLV